MNEVELAYMANLMILFLAVLTYLNIATAVAWHFRREVVAELWRVFLETAEAQISISRHQEDDRKE